METCSRKFYVSDRTAGRQVPANQHRIFCFNCDIEFPIAEWRVRKRNLRALLWRLRRGPSWEADRNEIDVFQDMTVCPCDVATDCCRRGWAGHRFVGVPAGGQRF